MREVAVRRLETLMERKNEGLTLTVGSDQIRSGQSVTSITDVQ